MGQITVRGIDPEIENNIRSIAKKSGKSINKIILEMINNAAGRSNHLKKNPCESLKKLAGGWSEDDIVEFYEAIKSCEQIDDNMWK